jgi:hypothetical protein
MHDAFSSSFCSFGSSAAVNIRRPSIIGQISRAVHVVTPPATRHEGCEKPPASHSVLRALKEPVIGCGCEISARSWLCNMLQREWRRSAYPKTAVGRPGMQTNRVSDRPRSGTQSLSLFIVPAHETRAPESFRRHSIHQMRYLCTGCAYLALQGCFSIVQQLSVGSQAAPRVAVRDDARWLRRFLPRREYEGPKDGTRRAQDGPKTHQMDFHVEIHPSRKNVRRRCTGTGV